MIKDWIIKISFVVFLAFNIVCASIFIDTMAHEFLHYKQFNPGIVKGICIEMLPANNVVGYADWAEIPNNATLLGSLHQEVGAYSFGTAILLSYVFISAMLAAFFIRRFEYYEN